MHCTARQLFKRSRGSLDSRQLCKNLRLAGFNVGGYLTRRNMCKLKLVVKQRQTYKITINRKHSNSVTDDLLGQRFNLP